jgi:hypothetical protein
MDILEKQLGDIFADHGAQSLQINECGLPLKNISGSMSRSERLETLAYNRNLFLGRLVSENEISTDYLELPSTRELLSRFRLAPENGRDALLHILIGDSGGGLHHTQTLMSSDAPSRSCASSFNHRDPQSSQFKHQADANGVFIASRLRLPDGEGVKIFKKKSSIFPSEWSSQRVLEAIRQTLAANCREKYQTTDQFGVTREAINYRHFVDGVEMIVGTDILSGEIITAYPLRRETSDEE